MGFNTKSQAGPYQGQQGQQRFQTDVMFGYFPVLIPALDYKLFGCNAVFDNPSFKIHEAYGVNTTIDKSIVQPAETLEFEQDVLSDDYDVYHLGSTLGTELTYATIDISLYRYMTSATGNYSVDRFVMPSVSELIFGTTLYYPNLPILYPWKYFYKVAGTLLTFAGHQIQVPVLFDETAATILTTDVGNDTLSAVRSSNTSRVNQSMTAYAALSLRSKYLMGATAAEFSSTADWTSKNDSATDHIRGMHVSITDVDGDGVDPFALCIMGKHRPSAGLSVVRVVNDTDVELYSGTSESNDDSISWAHGFMYVQDPAQVMSDIAVKYFATTAPMTSQTANTLPKIAAMYLYYICYRHEAESTKHTTSYGDIQITGASSHKSLSDFSSWQVDTSNTTSGFSTIGGLGTYASLILQMFTYISQAKDGTYFADIYTPEFTVACRAEQGTNDLTEIGEGTTKGFVYAIGSFIFLDCGFSKIEMKFSEEITDLTLTIGYWSSDWESPSSTDGDWRDIAISTATVSDFSGPASSYTSYILTTPSPGATDGIVDDMLIANKFITTFRSSYKTSDTDDMYKLNSVASSIADDFATTKHTILIVEYLF